MKIYGSHENEVTHIGSLVFGEGIFSVKMGNSGLVSVTPEDYVTGFALLWRNGHIFFLLETPRYSVHLETDGPKKSLKYLPNAPMHYFVKANELTFAAIRFGQIAMSSDFDPFSLVNLGIAVSCQN